MKSIVLRIFDLIKKGELKFMLAGISKRIISKNESFGLKRDLTIPYQNPDALIDISIRLFRAEDKDHFTKDLQNEGLIEKEIPNCYVAASKDDTPCFREWFISWKQNSGIKEFWGESIPVLKEGEALLESAFTVPNFRGHNIMPAAISKIVENGTDVGIKWVITFVAIDNIPSLKGCHRSGFSPYILRTEKWFLFKKTMTFLEIPKELMDTYSKNIRSTKPKS